MALPEDVHSGQIIGWIPGQHLDTEELLRIT